MFVGAYVVFVSLTGLFVSIVVIQAVWLVWYSAWLYAFPTGNVYLLSTDRIWARALFDGEARVDWSLSQHSIIGSCGWAATQGLIVLYQVLLPYTPWQWHRRRLFWSENGYTHEYHSLEQTAGAPVTLLALADLHIPARDTRPITGSEPFAPTLRFVKSIVKERRPDIIVVAGDATDTGNST